MNAFKVGMLLPRSSLYPSLAVDLVSGIKSAFNTYGIDNIQLYYENIGFGEVEANVYSKTEKMLLQDDVMLVIAYMDYMEAYKLEPLFASMNKLLLVLDPGGHIPTDWNTSPFCYAISLQAALGSRMTGNLAAKEGAVKPVFATSFYEGGYLQCFAYQKGIEKGGGQIQSHLVVPFKLEEFDINPLHDIVKQRQPDSILAQFSAEAGAVFFKKYIHTGLQNQLKFYSSPFMLEETWLETIDYPFDHITGYVTWLRNLSNETNLLFLNKIEETSQKKGTIFSMLGWEAAQFVIAFSRIINNYKKISLAQSELENLSIETPRGLLMMHADTHHFIAPMYLVEIIKNKEGRCSLKLISEKKSTTEEFELHVADKPEGVFSKWTNTYLCI
jgi:branched-chain amino acid transport system substrate-binding protein